MKSKDALDTLGTILTQDEGRDAVHVAVVCCEAWEQLEPGFTVERAYSKFDNDTPEGIPVVRQHRHGTLLGVVDPFLREPVLEGQMFWVFLTPRTITSLTHRWTHPAFPEEEK